jgi:GH15 family glucan-1,4-alpha-glucosidase
MQRDGRRFPASDKDAITSAPRGRGATVLASINGYDAGRSGALVEEVSAFRSDVEQFYDYHTLVWDAHRGETLDVRDDAVASDVTYESPRVPEVHVRNDFEFTDGAAAVLRQDVLVPVDRPALLVRSRVAFDADGDRTVYSIFDLGIDEWGHEQDVEAAALEHHDDEAFVTAFDGDRHLALAQRRPATGQRTFDGCRVGLQGVSTGPARSAWADIYEENDGWLDDAPSHGGKVDAGVGLWLGDARSAEWHTAVGFGRSATAARESARAALEAGYRDQRAAFRRAWETWHGGLSGPPCTDGTARDLYELSLTSMRVARDPSGATIAGAFKPHDMEYKHIWPRDLVVVVAALLAAGAREAALEGLAWLDGAQVADGVVDDRGIDRGGTWWQNYYATGDAHWEALQLDQVGGPVYAHWLAWRETGDEAVRERHAAMTRRAAEFLLSYDNGWGFPRRHQDPWEEVWGHTTGGTAAAVAGLRCAAELLAAGGETTLAARCRERADVWAGNLETYCAREDGLFGTHYVTADRPERRDTPPADRRPDAIAFTAVWPWNVRQADHETVQATLAHADDPAWRADGTACLGRYPGDEYTPSEAIEDGGWPLCEAYADVVRWASGADPRALDAYLVDDAPTWTTMAGLLPERVDGVGRVRWNANLQWSQAVYVLLAESRARGTPYGLAPGAAATDWLDADG